MKLDTIIKYIEGTINADEKKEIEVWFSVDPENKQYVKKVEKIWFAVDELKNLSKIDVNRDWNIIEKRISKKDAGVDFSFGFKRMEFPEWSRIAVVFVFGVVFASLFFYLMQDSLQNSQMAYKPYEISAPDGHRSNITLSDGTRIIINAGSRILLPHEYDLVKREIWLDGEAFFEVANDSKKPFFVHTFNLNVKVVGTTFNVRAYSGEGIIETTLLNGEVVLTRKEEQQDNKAGVTLNPNHKAIFINSRDAKITAEIRKEFEFLRPGEILISGLINPESAISWTKGKLIFEDEYLDVIVQRLERYYGVEIRIENEELKNLKYTGTLKNVSVESTLKALQLTTSIKFKTEDNRITLYR